MTAAVEPTRIPVACLAPPLTDQSLARYKALAESLPAGSEVRDAVLTLYRCVAAWWELPESERDGRKWTFLHKGKVRTVAEVPLEDAHVKALDPVTPWMRELVAMEPLLDGLTGDERDAAFHLMWHAKELTLDREPLTSDKLGG